MMGHRSKLTNGDEFDAFSRWRRILCYMQRPGIVAKIKRQHNKRIRKEARQECSLNF